MSNSITMPADLVHEVYIATVYDLPGEAEALYHDLIGIEDDAITPSPEQIEQLENISRRIRVEAMFRNAPETVEVESEMVAPVLNALSSCAEHLRYLLGEDGEWNSTTDKIRSLCERIDRIEAFVTATRDGEAVTA